MLLSAWNHAQRVSSVEVGPPHECGIIISTHRPLCVAGCLRRLPHSRFLTRFCWTYHVFSVDYFGQVHKDETESTAFLGFRYGRFVSIKRGVLVTAKRYEGIWVQFDRVDRYLTLCS